MEQKHTVEGLISRAHQKPEIYAPILAREMAKRAINIAQLHPMPKNGTVGSIDSTARMALARISHLQLQKELLPVALELIQNHGNGHRIHDMNSSFWELGVDSALNLITSYLERKGETEVVSYIKGNKGRRHLLHDESRLKMLSQYTYASVVYGGHHDMNSIWKGHDTSRTQPGNEQVINSIVRLNENGNLIPLIEADRIEDRSTFILAIQDDTIKIHTIPEKYSYQKPNVVNEMGNIDPRLYHDAVENRLAMYEEKNKSGKYSDPRELFSMSDFDGQKVTCDNGDKVKYTPWIIYTITDGKKIVFLHIHEKESQKSFLSHIKHTGDMLNK